ncbi:MAG: M23 family peptidase [Sphingopyxis sp.]|nr:M23 family peptidase [Sphingopyxis sp.]
MYDILVPMLLAFVSHPLSPGDRPAFLFPVGCTIGRSCLIQKLVDHDPGPARRDFRCGTLTTDGHDGTDIRLRTMADMRAGYVVVAAAAGRVLRTRDGEPDISVDERPSLDGKDAGNAVVIDHGDGWETQYSHLRRGSVGVRPGQAVAAGQAIGLIGLSGNTEFPHLHFSVRHRGATIDPFAAGGPTADCDAQPGPGGLWAPATTFMLTYRPTAVIAAGLASDVPPAAVVRRDPAPTLRNAHSPLILWVDALGIQPGDRQEFSIAGPDGNILHSQSSPVATGGLSWFAYSGKRAPAPGWPKGRYVGRYKVQRGSATIVSTEISANLY